MEENTLLHRQIHPNFVQNDSISDQAFLVGKNIASIAFIPSEKDDKKLSVYNGDKFTAEESYVHYTKQFSATGVLSLTVEECNKAGDLIIDEDNLPFNGHSFIDFEKLPSKGAIKNKAQKLRDIAVNRNWTYKK